ncbi:hypothetical protein AAMO2058_000530500 [Amorphochlora amoebiformis]|uniref:Calcium-regulated actin-bundling protein C-terminal domain-containing protein n=1 Tax=Amorphochlora amoebiformis TaxID=1561963 RepID=A0A7S0CZY7_9EUKA|mmetsp:Transcript_1679/g.2378  ORF Transcript_1679/g.2378 Transcript_1679/m.2378 type:complete len:322 (+) Transcript_1679:62-1027(+)
MSDKKVNLTKKFDDLVDKDIDGQLEFFLKSFIFDLGNDWKACIDLSKKFKKYLKDQTEKKDLNHVQASDFLQQNGKTRTGLERKKECKDIDLNSDGRICFIEYLLLHYKAMILKAYYKRKEIPIVEDLSRDGIGVVGVGGKILEELFTMPMGLDPKLIAAIEEFTAKKRAREKKIQKLEKQAEKGGVLGKAARNEIDQMMSQDLTTMNRVELTLNAAKRKGAKNSGAAELQARKEEEEKKKNSKLAAGRSKMAAMAAMWGGSKKAMLNKTKTKEAPAVNSRTKTLGKIKNKSNKQKLKKVSKPREGLAPWVKQAANEEKKA